MIVLTPALANRMLLSTNARRMMSPAALKGLPSVLERALQPVRYPPRTLTVRLRNPSMKHDKGSRS